jgi:DNA-binding transcriptional regulator YhcF (GntR family)
MEAQTPPETVSTDKYSPPKYFQISREIIGQIQGGEFATGSPVPSENEIIEKHRVSNTTARKALHELEKAGLRASRAKAPSCGIIRWCARSTAYSGSPRT